MVVITARRGVAPLALVLVFARMQTASAAGALGVLLVAASLVAMAWTEIAALTLLTAFPFAVVSTLWIASCWTCSKSRRPFPHPHRPKPVNPHNPMGHLESTTWACGV